MASHLGWWKTTDLAACNLWCPGMGCYPADYMKGCDLCNQTKTFPAPPAGKLMPNHISDWCWKVIPVDLITKLPQSHRHDAIMVIVDCLSKCTHVILTTSDIMVSGVALMFRDHVCKLCGLPEEVIIDRGTQWMSNFTHSLSQLLGIKITASTAYHPQTDSQIERVNQEIE